MCYIINVSTNEGHFFETHKNSIPNKETMEKVYKVFKEKFPVNEGYEVLVYNEVGKFLDMNYLNKELEEQNEFY